MERHPNRESVLRLLPEGHLGTDKVRISERPSTLVISFFIDDERGVCSIGSNPLVGSRFLQSTQWLALRPAGAADQPQVRLTAA